MVTRQNATERVVAPSLPRAAGVGPGVVGEVVADGVSQFSSTCVTPHDVDAHGVLQNAQEMYPSVTSTHQPRSWSKAEAP